MSGCAGRSPIWRWTSRSSRRPLGETSEPLPSGSISESYRGPPGAAAEMWPATPTLISSSPPEVAPTVGSLHDGYEHSHPTRIAIWSFIFFLKSSLLSAPISFGCAKYQFRVMAAWFRRSDCLIRDRPSSPVAAQSLNRRRHWITGSVPRQRLLGPSSYRNRLNSTSVECMASAVAIFGDSILTCIASRSTWLLPNTSGLHPTDAFLLGLQVYLRSAVPAPPRPPYSLASPNLHTRAPTVPVIASEPAGFNLAHTFGGNCRRHRFGGPKSGVFIRSRGDGREEATETNRARPGTARKRHWPGNSITRRPNEYAG